MTNKSTIVLLLVMLQRKNPAFDLTAGIQFANGRKDVWHITPNNNDVTANLEVRVMNINLRNYLFEHPWNTNSHVVKTVAYMYSGVSTIRVLELRYKVIKRITQCK